MTDMEKNAIDYCAADIDMFEDAYDPVSTWQKARDDYWTYMLSRLVTLVEE